MVTAKVLRFLVILLAAGQALSTLPARAEIELSFYGGAQTTHPGTVRSATLGDDRVSWQARPFASPPYYGVRGQWWRNRNLGFGLDFTHAKAYADDPAKYGYDSLNFSHGLNILTADIWYRFEPFGKLTPYVGAGIGAAIPHVEVQPAGSAPTARYQVAGPAASLALGLSMPVTQRWSVFTEYKASYSRLRVRLDTGDRLNTDIFTQAVNLGVSLRF